MRRQMGAADFQQRTPPPLAMQDHRCRCRPRRPPAAADSPLRNQQLLDQQPLEKRARPESLAPATAAAAVAGPSANYSFDGGCGFATDTTGSPPPPPPLPPGEDKPIALMAAADLPLTQRARRRRRRRRPPPLPPAVDRQVLPTMNPLPLVRSSSRQHYHHSLLCRRQTQPAAADKPPPTQQQLEHIARSRRRQDLLLTVACKTVVNSPLALQAHSHRLRRRRSQLPAWRRDILPRTPPLQARCCRHHRRPRRPPRPAAVEVTDLPP